jgi:hypothetical protein
MRLAAVVSFVLISKAKVDVTFIYRNISIYNLCILPFFDIQVIKMN